MPNFCINFLNKAAKLLSISYDFAVAPSSDAWIKTVTYFSPSAMYRVAPSSDAWIKTFIILIIWVKLYRSHPPRMRGLKLSRSLVSAHNLRRTLLGCVD